MKIEFNPRLEFYLELPNTPTTDLIKGYLLLKLKSDSAGIKFEATSGSRGNQYIKSWRLKGKGPLPPSTAISPKRYTVSTQRLWLPHVKGVEGSFYAIAPFMVKAANLNRGDFGIHFDANVPGSAGCCVLTIDEQWDQFRKEMAKLRDSGFQQLPLLTVYR